MLRTSLTWLVAVAVGAAAGGGTAYAIASRDATKAEAHLSVVEGQAKTDRGAIEALNARVVALEGSPGQVAQLKSDVSLLTDRLAQVARSVQYEDSRVSALTSCVNLGPHSFGIGPPVYTCWPDAPIQFQVDGNDDADLSDPTISLLPEMAQTLSLNPYAGITPSPRLDPGK